MGVLQYWINFFSDIYSLNYYGKFKQFLGDSTLKSNTGLLETESSTAKTTEIGFSAK